MIEVAFEVIATPLGLLLILAVAYWLFAGSDFNHTPTRAIRSSSTPAVMRSPDDNFVTFSVIGGHYVDPVLRTVSIEVEAKPDVDNLLRLIPSRYYLIVRVQKSLTPLDGKEWRVTYVSAPENRIGTARLDFTDLTRMQTMDGKSMGIMTDADFSEAFALMSTRTVVSVTGIRIPYPGLPM